MTEQIPPAALPFGAPLDWAELRPPMRPLRAYSVDRRLWAAPLWAESRTFVICQRSGNGPIARKGPYDLISRASSQQVAAYDSTAAADAAMMSLEKAIEDDLAIAAIFKLTDGAAMGAALKGLPALDNAYTAAKAAKEDPFGLVIYDEYGDMIARLPYPLTELHHLQIKNKDGTMSQLEEGPRDWKIQARVAQTVEFTVRAKTAKEAIKLAKTEHAAQDYFRAHRATATNFKAQQ